jgi:hypothetical protein
VTTFYCLKFETPPTWRARSPYSNPQEQGCPIITPGTGFPFRRLLRLAGLRWRYSTAAPHGRQSFLCSEHLDNTSRRTENRTLSETEKVRVTLRLAVYRQSVRLGAKPLETHGLHFFQLNTCSHSPYVTSSLTRGWVCRLKLLLALASVVISRSTSRGTHDHILLSQIRDSPNLEDQVVFSFFKIRKVG